MANVLRKSHEEIVIQKTDYSEGQTVGSKHQQHGCWNAYKQQIINQGVISRFGLHSYVVFYIFCSKRMTSCLSTKKSFGKKDT